MIRTRAEPESEPIAYNIRLLPAQSRAYDDPARRAASFSPIVAKHRDAEPQSIASFEASATP